jgi:hypothetical protein
MLRQDSSLCLRALGQLSEGGGRGGGNLLRALESPHSYEERGIPMQAWLFKIAHNLIVDYLQKAA